MIYSRSKKPDGTFFEVRGPPYTPEEEHAFYARYDKGMQSGQATVVHRGIKDIPPPPGFKPRPQPPRRSAQAEAYSRALPYRRNLGFIKDDDQ